MEPSNKFFRFSSRKFERSVLRTVTKLHCASMVLHRFHCNQKKILSGFSLASIHHIACASVPVWMIFIWIGLSKNCCILLPRLNRVFNFLASGNIQNTFIGKQLPNISALSVATPIKPLTTLKRSAEWNLSCLTTVDLTVNLNPGKLSREIIRPLPNRLH